MLTTPGIRYLSHRMMSRFTFYKSDFLSRRITSGSTVTYQKRYTAIAQANHPSYPHDPEIYSNLQVIAISSMFLRQNQLDASNRMVSTKWAKGNRSSSITFGPDCIFANCFHLMEIHLF